MRSVKIISWINKQPIIDPQKSKKSRRTTEAAVGKKRKRRQEAEEDREMIKKLAAEGSAVRDESSFQLHLRRKL